MRLLVLIATLILMPITASAVTPLDRLSGGVDASGTQVVSNSGTQTSFTPGAWLSYSLAENLSASTSYRYYTEGDSQEVRAGLRLIAVGTQPGDRIQWAIGADALYLPEFGEVAPTVSLRGSIGLLKDTNERMDAYIFGNVEYAPKWERKWYQLGVRFPLFGGGPR